MHDVEILELNSAPDRIRMNELLMGYYTGLIADLVSVGGPNIDPAGPIADFWDNLDEFLPPDGALLVARDGDRWLGTGALRTATDDRGELKRLFVHKDARGTGIGRKLVTRRIEIAREMGLKTLLVDTLTTTVEMQSLYASLGFRKIDPYAESVSYQKMPEAANFMLFFQMDL